MRRLVMMMFLLAPLTELAALAAPAKPTPIDVKPVVAKLSVFRDDVGQFYVVPTPGKWDDFDEAGKFVFYGDGKSMWQQRIVGFSSSDGELVWNVWSPRVKDMVTASMQSKSDGLVVECSRSHEPRKLVALRADEAKAFFTTATFLPPLWQRLSKFLARDDNGTYYFVDNMRDEFGGKDFRVFAGKKGQLVELPMTNVVEDSGGEIYATKNGQLKIVANANNRAYWVQGAKKTELTVLEPTDNRYLIYRELGMYKQLGTVCEDN